MLHPVYFFNNRSSVTTASHLLVQHGASFCSFSLFNKAQQEVNAWVLYELTAPFTHSLLKHVIAQQEWLQQSFQSVTIIDYTHKNTWVPRSLVKEGTETALLDLMTASRVQTVTMEDAAGEAVNLYCVHAPAYTALNQQFDNAQWLHHETLVMKQPAREEPVITVEIWFNTLFLFAQHNGQWLLLQQRNYQTPEDVLYHLLNCKQQWNMGDDVVVQLQGMVEEQSALYNLLHQYILNLEWQKELVFTYPGNTSDIPNHTKQLVDRIITCVS